MLNTASSNAHHLHAALLLFTKFLLLGVNLCTWHVIDVIPQLSVDGGRPDNLTRHGILNRNFVILARRLGVYIASRVQPRNNPGVLTY